MNTVIIEDDKGMQGVIVRFVSNGIVMQDDAYPTHDRAECLLLLIDIQLWCSVGKLP